LEEKKQEAKSKLVSEGKISDKPPASSWASLATKKSSSGIASKDIPSNEENKSMSDALKTKPPSRFSGGMQKSFIGAKKTDLLDESPSAKPKIEEKKAVKPTTGGIKPPLSKPKDSAKQSFIEPPLKSSFI